MQTRMAIRHFTQLDAWRLADQLETEVIQLVQSTSANRDFTYRDELLDAVSSVPSNIAEGFTRKSPREECRFFDIALASLSETQTRLNGGLKRKHFTTSQVTPLIQLAHRAFKAAVGYKRHQLKYLRDHPPPPRTRTVPRGKPARRPANPPPPDSRRSPKPSEET